MVQMSSKCCCLDHIVPDVAHLILLLKSTFSETDNWAFVTADSLTCHGRKSTGAVDPLTKALIHLKPPSNEIPVLFQFLFQLTLLTCPCGVFFKCYKKNIMSENEPSTPELSIAAVELQCINDTLGNTDLDSNGFIHHITKKLFDNTVKPKSCVIYVLPLGI